MHGILRPRRVNFVSEYRRVTATSSIGVQQWSRRIYFKRYRRLDDPIIKTGVDQGLPNIFVCEFRIFPAQVITVRVERQKFNNTAHRQSPQPCRQCLSAVGGYPTPAGRSPGSRPATPVTNAFRLWGVTPRRAPNRAGD